MFFPHLKLTLRNNVVVETEEVFDEPGSSGVRRPVAEAVAPASTPLVAPEPAATKAGAPAAAPEASGARAAQAAGGSNESASAAGLEIKSVRPPTANAPRSTTKAPTKAPEPTSPTKAAPPSTAKAATTTPAPAPAPKVVVPTPVVSTAPISSAPSVAMTSASATSAPETTPATEKPAEWPQVTPEPVEPRDTKKQKTAPKRSLFGRHALNDDDFDTPIFTTQTYIFGAAVIAAIGYLLWWRRQRSLELAVTTVSNTPFDEKVPVDNSAMFTLELLGKLEWKRFEELVAAYYLKTGVVAVRTKTGPDSPVHLKISWKGEAKPFAGVQCIANPPGLIRSGPLTQLAEALTASDIRRGYVVTNGKFNVEARDLASEKHFTLLSGDILIEKLNALPPAARAELMQETMKGDYTTPTCPKCEVKMVRLNETSWRCANHPRCEQVIPPVKA
jgi:hypothetical protein